MGGNILLKVPGWRCWTEVALCHFSPLMWFFRRNRVFGDQTSGHNSRFSSMHAPFGLCRLRLAARFSVFLVVVTVQGPGTLLGADLRYVP